MKIIKIMAYGVHSITGETLVSRGGDVEEECDTCDLATSEVAYMFIGETSGDEFQSCIPCLVKSDEYYKIEVLKIA